jgi:hypothetical protein
LAINPDNGKTGIGIIKQRHGEEWDYTSTQPLMLVEL